MMPQYCQYWSVIIFGIGQKWSEHSTKLVGIVSGIGRKRSKMVEIWRKPPLGGRGGGWLNTEVNTEVNTLSIGISL